MFREFPCDVYYDNASSECLFSREQIGTALGYTMPSESIRRIHQRHKDRLDRFSVCARVDKGETQLVSPLCSGGGAQNTVMYTRKGVFEICRWSRQPLADAFMDFVWDITDNIFAGKYELSNRNDHKVSELESDIKELKLSINTLASELHDLVNKSAHISGLVEERTTTSNTLAQKWKASQITNIQLVASHIGITDKKVLYGIYSEMEDRYGINLNTMCFGNSVVPASRSRLDAISSNLGLREMFDVTINDLMRVCGVI